MNENNFSNLKDQIKRAGFGKEFEGQLKESLEKGQPEFVLSQQYAFDKDTATVSAVFKKDGKSEGYDISRYDIETAKQGKQPQTQSFDTQGQPPSLAELKKSEVGSDFASIRGRAKNFDYLKDQIKYTGFGDELESKLKEHLIKAEPGFALEYKTTIGKDQASALLHFRKSSESDHFFFNRYDLSLNQDGQKDALKQTFHIGYDNNITFKEGYNLMSGRAVHKEMAQLIDTGENGNKRLEAKGDKYHAWLQMDFKQSDQNGNFKIKQFHENYGFNLEQVLARHPIKELASEQDKKELIESLQKGNRQSVTFIIADKEEKRYIEAAPQFKSINQYDANMQRTGWKKSKSENESESQKQGEVQTQTEGKDKKQQQKQNAEDPVSGKKTSRAKSKGQSVP